MTATQRTMVAVAAETWLEDGIPGEGRAWYRLAIA